MKDGQVIESGVHKELLALNGEYATMYNIQAQAFASEVHEVGFDFLFDFRVILIKDVCSWD